MEKIDERAFPVATVDGYTQYGLTMRDYFAAKAMQAYVYPDMLMPADTDEMCQMLIDNCANFSYRMADAMLRAREA